MPAKTTRPRQANLAVGLIMAGSVVAVLLAFQRVSGLTSLETRQAFEEMLAQPRMRGLGLGVETLIGFTRAMSFVVAGGATATAILAYFALQRSRGARIALSVLAPVLFLAGVFVAGFVCSFVAVGTLLLWLRPTRDWYAGRAWSEPQRPGRPATSGAGRDDPSRNIDVASPSQQPPTAPTAAPDTTAYPDLPGPAPATGQGGRAVSGFGAGPDAHPFPSRVATPPTGAAHRSPATYAAAPRPAPVWIACLVTWAVNGLVLVLVTVTTVAVLVSPDLLLDEVLREQPELRDQGVNAGALQTGTAALAVAVGLWCVFAIVAAVLAFRRVAWARTGLAISAGIAGGLSLVVALFTLGAGGIGLAVPLVASMVTLSALLRPESRAWYARR